MGWGGMHWLTARESWAYLSPFSVAFPSGQSELSDLRGDEVQLLHFCSRSHLWFWLLELLKLSYWPPPPGAHSPYAAVRGGGLWQSIPEPYSGEFKESDNVTVNLSCSGLVLPRRLNANMAPCELSAGESLRFFHTSILICSSSLLHPLQLLILPRRTISPRRGLDYFLKTGDVCT